jgi:acetylornithine deacetylase/succinyl-diaminopimelate desuccinylase-like protein
LRGVFNCDVEVRTLAAAIHSGLFGGPVPDALTALARLLASLHDDAGNVVVEGLVSATGPDLELSEERLRAEAGMVDGVQLMGTGPVVGRLWHKPAVSVIAVDAPSLKEAANALVPVARAKVSTRIAPGDDVEKAFAALRAHFDLHLPWGVALTVEFAGSGAPSVIDTSGPHYETVRSALREAWDGVDAVDIGLGGSVPAIDAFQQAFPAATIVVTGVEDPHTRAHGPNESLHLGEFRRVCLAEALLLAGLG